MVSKFKYILLLLVFIHFLLSGTSKQGEAYEYFLEGEYEMLQNNFRNAEKHYIKALSLSPDSPTILQSLVDLKSYQGKYLEAILYLEKIMEIEPGNQNAGLDLYKLHIQGGDTIKAELVLDSLLTQYPGDLDILFFRANIQFTNEDWSNLLKTYQAIYVSDPDQKDLLIKIYEIGIATGNIDLVREIFRELKSVSGNYIILELLVKIANNLGEYFEAIDLMQELIEITGNTDNQKINLSELYLRAEQYEKVISILQPIYETGNYSLDILRMLLISFSSLRQVEKEINISKTLLNEYPELSVGYEALSYAYIQSGSNEKAVNILLESLSKFPDEVTFPYSLATLYYNSGDYLKAENYFHNVLSIQPDMISAKRALAMIYEEMNDTNRSDSLFLQMIELDQNDVVSQNDYAYILSERNKISPKKLHLALELATNAIAIEPDNPAFLDTIGWIYYKLGTYHKAEEYLEKSLSINNNNPVILEHLGDIYIKLNKSSEAVIIYEKVLKMDIKNQLIKNKISKIYE